MDERSAGAVSQDRIVAVGLLSQEDLDRLGTSFQRVFPLGQDNGFDELLKAIDAAERSLLSESEARYGRK